MASKALTEIPVLIPAYNPDRTLISVATDLHALGAKRIVIINDGSKSECEPIFEDLRRAGFTVLSHAVNLGKGRALKTGLNHCYCVFPEAVGVVTADADGQHLPKDIAGVMESLQENPSKLVLGVRKFKKEIPFRSLLGNVLTKFLFRVLIGKKISDTQTGLRGIPRSAIPRIIKLHGEFYEFELNMLIETKLIPIDIFEREIEVVYIAGNQSSHFNPIKDSMRIYFVLFRFVLASLVTAVADYIVFMLTFRATGNAFLGTYGARGVAAFINYTLVRNFVFHSKEQVRRTLFRYLTLVAVMGFVSYSLLLMFVKVFHFDVLQAKVFSELLIYLGNFAIQRDFVFKNSTEASDISR